MKPLQTPILIATACALLIFAMTASASATILTGSNGATLPTGTKFNAQSEGTITLHPPIGDIECSNLELAGETTNAGGSSETVSATLLTHDCTGTNATNWFVLTNGSWEIHTQETKANNNGLITSTGTELTVVFDGFHCIYRTNSTPLGPLQDHKPREVTLQSISRRRFLEPVEKRVHSVALPHQ